MLGVEVCVCVCVSDFLLALPTKARIPVVFRFIIEYSSLMDFGP